MCVEEIVLIVSHIGKILKMGPVKFSEFKISIIPTSLKRIEKRAGGAILT